MGLPRKSRTFLCGSPLDPLLAGIMHSICGESALILWHSNLIMLVYVDIDGTICSLPEAARGSLDYARAEPYPGRIKKINDLFDGGDTIVYWTARGTRSGVMWYDRTREQLEAWGCKYHELRMGKPAYDLFIDDKNVSDQAYFGDG